MQSSCRPDQGLNHSFNVIVVADFRFPGGTSSAVAAEVRALHRGNHRVALYQMDSPILRSSRHWNERILALVENGDAVVLPADNAASCDVLLVHSPWLFVEAQAEQPQIRSKLRILITHHTPTDANGRLNYDPAIIDRHACRTFGRPFYWGPISPVCRDSFERAGMMQPRLRDDWTNVVYVDDWGKARPGLRGERPVVGRHSRPQLEKWPASRADLIAAYPEDVEVRLLGVGDRARALLEPIPDGWVAWDFNEISVKDFLAGIDFFVYFHHPDWIETFGLTIAEAAAAGCIVVTHPYLERTFGKAALYCPPARAPALVRKIAQDPRLFAELSAQGREAINNKFGPDEYLARFRRLLAASRHGTLLKEVVVQPKRGARYALIRYTKRLAYWSLYWWHNEILPGWQQLLRSKTLRRPMRKVAKALKVR